MVKITVVEVSQTGRLERVDPSEVRDLTDVPEMK
ncbi:hypothetical protein EMGBS4_16130, partial [Acidimicrobiaceae bacterium]